MSAIPANLSPGSALPSKTVDVWAAQDAAPADRTNVARPVAGPQDFDAFGLPNTQNPLKDANGAPALAAPLAGVLHDEELANLLDFLVNTGHEGQKKNMENRIEANRNKSLKANESQKVKIQDELSADLKAQKAARRAKILGWIGKIVAVVAAVVATVATVATAGAASPLMALAVIGLVGASISFIDQCVKEKNPDSSFSISKLLTKAVEGFLTKVGVDKDTAGRIGLVAAGGVGVLTGAILVEPQLLGDMSKGICELAGASDKTKMIVTMAVGTTATVTIGVVMALAARKIPNDSMNKVVRMLMGVGTNSIQGSTQVASGVNTIAQARYQANASEISVDKKKIDALMVELQNEQEQTFDSFKRLLLMSQASTEDFTEMIGEYYKNSSSIMTNLGNSKVAV
ncbi:type III secretion system translocon subunit SctE [Ottowia thiooxydans]|uniref:Translocator protein BipB-like C-terminal domain-containing protein n=1 Tax=Ottowia thiooxydans TaxID=219182 RepID=A0ABV2QGD6_9BURK